MIRDNIEANKFITPNSLDIEFLKINFPYFFNDSGEFLLEQFKQQLKEQDITFNKEGYELNFLGKAYARYLSGAKTETFLAPHVEHNRLDENKNSENVYIIGDNLEALRHLLGSYIGKIKCIYIDPPYNTGEDFIYNDSFAFTADDLVERIGIDRQEAERILDLNGKSSHSAWLTFMYPRLVLARLLLREDGVIFISIDDNEFAQLKILCDMIFGETNYIGEYIKQSKVGGGNDSKFIVKEHEYCLCYAKNIEKTFEMNISHDDDYLKRYKEKDEFGRYFWDTFARPGLGLKSTLTYDIVMPDGTINNNRWIRSKDRFKKEYAEGKIRIIKNRDNNWSVQFKQYLNMEGKTPRSMTMDFGGTTDGDKEIKQIFGKKVFNYPKSVRYLSTLLSTITNKDITVLDFFAGSGTTGQAVMELNKKDGGSRKFILCTNNENNICEDITYERLSRVIKGYDFEGKIKDDLKSYNLNISNLKKMDSIFQEFEEIKSEKKEEYDKFSNQSKDGVLKLIGEKEILDKVAGIPHNLKYYKTEFIPKLSEDEEILSSKLLDYIKELVELENMCEIDGDSRRIILSDEDLKIALSEMEEGSVLYIPSFILLTNEIKDSIDGRKLEVVTIPDYYFTEELREVNEL